MIYFASCLPPKGHFQAAGLPFPPVDLGQRTGRWEACLRIEAGRPWRCGRRASGWAPSFGRWKQRAPTDAAPDRQRSRPGCDLETRPPPAGGTPWCDGGLVRLTFL